MASDEDRVLDAARDAVLAVGARRATVTDVARRAGLSRMTVYRRFPDAEALLAALMTREFAAVVELSAAEVDQASGDLGARERIVRGVIHGADLLAANPLWQRILDVDPELVLPYVTVRLGRFQQLMLERLAAMLAEGMEEGSVRDDDPHALAATIELALRGWVVAARGDAEPAQRTETLRRLEHMLDAALRPAEVRA